MRAAPLDTGAAPPLLRMAALALAALVAGLPAAGQQRTTDASPVFGAPASFEGQAGERLEVEAGTALRREPNGRSAVLVTVDVASELDVVSRQDGWVQVRYEAWLGWIARDPEEATLPAPGLLERPLLAPTSERVARAREQLQGEPLARRVGDYELLSDVTSEELLEVVAGALRQVDSAYREWYGLDPGPAIGETIVVFARQESYLAFRAEEPVLGSLDPVGHAGGGLAVLYAENRQAQELGSIAVHEMVHLLNRRTFRHELPNWLEEGLASALGWARRDPDGRPIPGSLWEVSTVREEVVHRGARRVTRIETEMQGPRVELGRLLQQHRAGDLLPLGDLLELPPSLFLSPDGIESHYGLSAALVRFFLEGEEGRWREGFQRFLAGAPRRPLTGPEQLASALGGGLEEIEDQLWRWLAGKVRPAVENGLAARAAGPP